MKLILAGTALALMASVAQAQQTALDVALAQNPAPCGGAANIAAAQYDTNEMGQDILRVTCGTNTRSTLSTQGTTPPPAGPLVGLGGLAPVIGIAVVGAGIALSSGGGGGSSSSDTQVIGLN